MLARLGLGAGVRRMVFPPCWKAIWYYVLGSCKEVLIFDSVLSLLGINHRKPEEICLSNMSCLMDKGVWHDGFSKIRVSPPQHSWHLGSRQLILFWRAVLGIAGCLGHPWTLHTPTIPLVTTIKTVSKTGADGWSRSLGFADATYYIKNG